MPHQEALTVVRPNQARAGRRAQRPARDARQSSRHVGRHPVRAALERALRPTGRVRRDEGSGWPRRPAPAGSAHGRGRSPGRAPARPRHDLHRGSRSSLRPLSGFSRPGGPYARQPHRLSAATLGAESRVLCEPLRSHPCHRSDRRPSCVRRSTASWTRTIAPGRARSKRAARSRSSSGSDRNSAGPCHRPSRRPCRGGSRRRLHRVLLAGVAVLLAPVVLVLLPFWLILLRRHEKSDVPDTSEASAEARRAFRDDEDLAGRTRSSPSAS